MVFSLESMLAVFCRYLSNGKFLPLDMNEFEESQNSIQIPSVKVINVKVINFRERYEELIELYNEQEYKHVTPGLRLYLDNIKKELLYLRELYPELSEPELKVYDIYLARPELETRYINIQI